MNIQEILNSHEKLIDLARQFIDEKQPVRRTGDIRIENGWIEEYVNTACHCHPEYEWVERETIELFEEWLKPISS